MPQDSAQVTKSVISTVGAACGPGIAAVGLALLGTLVLAVAAHLCGSTHLNPRAPDWLAVLSGDKWEPYQIKIIMVLGLLLMLPTILPLFVFHDPKRSPVANGVNGASPESRQSTEARAKRLVFLKFFDVGRPMQATH